jgi:hypothetical protein
MLSACWLQPAPQQPAATAAALPSATAQASSASAECSEPNPSDLEACILYLRSCADAPVSQADEGAELRANARRFERRGDGQSARKAYFTLIAKKPRSGYVPSAYLAFAELFFAEARAGLTGEQRCTGRGTAILAAESYHGALSFDEGPASVPLVAHFRLGQIYATGIDCTRASAEFEEASKLAGPGRDSPCARTLITAARSRPGAIDCAQAAPCPTSPDPAPGAFDGTNSSRGECSPGDLACAIRARTRSLSSPGAP